MFYGMSITAFITKSFYFVATLDDGCGPSTVYLIKFSLLRISFFLSKKKKHTNTKTSVNILDYVYVKTYYEPFIIPKVKTKITILLSIHYFQC